MAETKTVEIKGMKFQPSPITLARGDTVQWTNRDAMAHTVTADNGEFDSGKTLGKGESFSHTFPDAGTFWYHCEIHPSMRGQVVVT